ncbi:MAG TPA: SDR family NAD(P)-dependent oxidoreductase [Candidatus Sulfotelmatobacter sp.]|nr:SDR family NAD(P)-dependent oxidoreductase [Candidatus Sulfotelmatobacter sp.]
MNISRQPALVTGGASGLGAATARLLAARGAKVTVLDVAFDRAQEVAREIGGVAAKCDVASPTEVAAALDLAQTHHGPVRILVNCAGIGTARRMIGRDGPMPLEDFERVIRVNLIGTFNVTRLASAAMSTLEPLADGERGVVVSTASVAAFDGQIGQAAYSASKGGIAALTLPLARELAQFGIRVMTIAPGLFQTPLLGQLPPDVQTSLGASIPFPKRLGTAEEFAQLVLACCENSYLNGETIRLDGALRLPPR